jgi:hypothetical protein
MHKLFKNARWIWPAPVNLDETDRRVQYRKTFELNAIPKHAELLITADSLYVLWVNGNYAGRGPARGFHGQWPFDRVEIAPYLKAGSNVLAVMAYQYGISTFSYLYNHGSGLLISGRAGTTDLCTGAAWKMREAPGYARGVARLSQQLGFEELFDARIEVCESCWKSINYDDSKWLAGNAFAMLVPDAMPWHEFEERGIPALTKDVALPKKLLACSSWQSTANWRVPQNISQLFFGEKRDWAPASGHAEELCFAMQAEHETADAYLIDFGQEVVGTPILEISGASGGEVIDILAFESLTGLMPDLYDPSRSCRISIAGRLATKTGNNHHEFTMIWGFRYLALVRRGVSAELKIKASLHQTIYPLKETGYFRASDTTLNDIWNICRHSQRMCMLDAYVDCPWREQAQWWGDALVQAHNTFALAADARLLARGIRQLGTQKVPNGLTYGHAPTMSHHCILPDFSLVWIITHWNYYFQTADTGLFVIFQERVWEILEYFQGRAARNGLQYFDERYWLFLDWSNQVHKDGAPTILNLQYLWALRCAEKLFVLTGDTKRADECARRATELLIAISSFLYDGKAGILYDGLTFTGERVKIQSPHAAALAIILNIFPEAHDRFLQKLLLPLVCGKRAVPVLPSSFFMFYIYEALKQKGYRRETLDSIRRWWGEWCDIGLTSTPENWNWRDYRGALSMCHAWSAHPLLHFAEIVLGVKQLAPGWQAVSFSPLAIKGQQAEGAVATPFGPIKVRWDWTGGKLSRAIKHPAKIKVIEIESENS